MTTLTLAESLDRLPAIGLAELNERADLLTRVDRKYVVERDELDAVARLLPADTLVLEIDGDRSFDYRSTYLDTETLDAYFDAARKRRRRWKVRSRLYLASGLSFLEVKTRRGPSTVKERIPWSGVRLGQVGGDFVEASLRSAGVGVDASGLTPVVTTCYRRTTLLLPSSGARVTIDSDLSWSDIASGRRVGFGDRLIIETKTASAPSDLDRLLWSHGVRPVALSKYAVGMAALEPTLPHNRWHRLMATRLLAAA